MLDRERHRKELSSQISRRVIPTDDMLSQSINSDAGDSHITNDSMNTYYEILLAPRLDDVSITRKRLENLQAVANARTKLIKMNDTICNAESTLMEAYRNSTSEGLALSSVKFRKHNQSWKDHESPHSDERILRAQHIHDEQMLNSSLLTPTGKKSTFMVDEKILRTIEHSIKGKESKVHSLEKELSLGLGLMKVRNTPKVFDQFLFNSFL